MGEMRCSEAKEMGFYRGLHRNSLIKRFFMNSLNSLPKRIKRNCLKRRLERHHMELPGEEPSLEGRLEQTLRKKSGAKKIDARKKRPPITGGGNEIGCSRF